MEICKATVRVTSQIFCHSQIQKLETRTRPLPAPNPPCSSIIKSLLEIALICDLLRTYPCLLIGRIPCRRLE